MLLIIVKREKSAYHGFVCQAVDQTNLAGNVLRAYHSNVNATPSVVWRRASRYNVHCVVSLNMWRNHRKREQEQRTYVLTHSKAKH
jgi:hypothetical protein